MKVALYARVSTEKQAENDLSISAQIKTLHKYCRDRGWDIVKEFLDEGESARSAKRPAFQEMIAHAKQKHKSFDAIVVWKLSRFARNREDSIIYKTLLRKHGVNVISMNEQIDDSPTGKLLEGIIEAIDEFYSANLAQDTKRGQKENASRGFRSGGTSPIGYKVKRVKDGHNERTTLEIDENYAPIIRRIFSMCLEGMGAKEIVKILNDEGLLTNLGKSWSKNHVYYILKNEVYTGTLLWNKRTRNVENKPDDVVRIENSHEPIVDRETFQKVQEVLKFRSPKVTKPRTINSRFLLSGFIYCGKCGYGMIGTSGKSSQFHYYACQNYCKRGKKVCDAKSFSKENLEVFVVDRLKDAILTEENLAELVHLTNKELNSSKVENEDKLATIEAQLDQHKERLHKLYDALETGKISLDDLSPRIKELTGKIRDLENQKFEMEVSLKNDRYVELSPSLIKAYVDDLKELLRKGTLLEQKAFLRSFIKRIEVDQDKVGIEYTMPLKNGKKETYGSEVLSTAQLGVADGIRTHDLQGHNLSL